MTEFNPTFRLPTRPLSYDNKDIAQPKEIVVDYTTGHLYVSDVNGNLLDTSLNINDIEQIIRDNPDAVTEAIITLEDGNTITVKEAILGILSSISSMTSELEEVRTAAETQTDYTEADDTKVSFLKNKPTKLSDFTLDDEFKSNFKDALAGTADGFATLDENSKVTADQATAYIVSITGSSTLALSNAGKFLMCSASAATTITVPADTTVNFPIGTEIEICRYSDSTVTFAAESGVTLVSADSAKSISTKYGCACLKKLSSNTWLLAGCIE